jgi:hypothetical protein
LTNSHTSLPSYASVRAPIVDPQSYPRAMDAYPYREPPLARSPTERTSWAGRDDSYREGRSSDRTERVDTFYRGRSPGMFIFYLCGTGHDRRMATSLCASLHIIFSPSLSRCP